VTEVVDVKRAEYIETASEQKRGGLIVSMVRYNGIDQDDDGVYVLYEEALAALAAETSRCAQIIWEYRGMCVSDESARALMDEVRRE
jgi:hypothetical protein